MMTQLKKIVSGLTILSIFSFYLSFATATESRPFSQYHISQYHVGNVSIASTGTSMLIVTGNNKIDIEHLFKLQKLMQPSWNDYINGDTDIANRVWNDRHIEVLSVVGNYASIKTTNTISGGSAVTKFGEIYVIDLTKPNKIISLTNFFSEKEILAAFANADSPLLKSAGLAVMEANGNLSDLNVSGLASDYLHTFAFSDVGNGFVTVIFSSGDGYNYDESYLIKLKAPKKLEKMLLNAKNMKSGFLVKNRDQIRSLPVAYRILKLPLTPSFPNVTCNSDQSNSCKLLKPD